MTSTTAFPFDGAEYPIIVQPYGWFVADSGRVFDRLAAALSAAAWDAWAHNPEVVRGMQLPVVVARAAADLHNVFADPPGRPSTAVTPQGIVVRGTALNVDEVQHLADTLAEWLTPEWAAGAIGAAVRDLRSALASAPRED